MRGRLNGMAVAVGVVLIAGLCTASVAAALAPQNPPCPPVPQGKVTKECGQYVWVPPVYKTCEERVCVKPCSERCETIPAEYKTATRQVCVKP